MSHAQTYLEETAALAQAIEANAVERLVITLSAVRDAGGRLFLIGVGGAAANCSHAASDFRKLCGIEAYAPTDNIAELTARTNDEGWRTVFAAWLRTSQAKPTDALMVFSVGGGDAERNVSANIVDAIKEAKARGMTVMGIVGRDGGYTARAGDVVIVVPTVAAERVTPHTEAFQAVLWHCLVSHPDLALEPAKWEGVAAIEGRSGN